MTEQEYIEKMARDIKESLHCSCWMINTGTCNGCEFLKYRKHGTDCQAVCIASALYREDYRKLSDGDIVLSREDLKLYAKDCICGELTGLDIINGLIEKAKRRETEARRETAKEILDYFDKYAGTGKKLIGNMISEQRKKYGVSAD